MIVRAVIDLPDPDSPTRPTASPGATSSVASWITVRSRAPRPSTRTGSRPISPASSGSPTRKGQTGPSPGLPIHRRNVPGGVINEYHQAASGELI